MLFDHIMTTSIGYRYVFSPIFGFTDIFLGVSSKCWIPKMGFDTKMVINGLIFDDWGVLPIFKATSI